MCLLAPTRSQQPDPMRYLLPLLLLFVGCDTLPVAYAPENPEPAHTLVLKAQDGEGLRAAALRISDDTYIRCPTRPDNYTSKAEHHFKFDADEQLEVSLPAETPVIAIADGDTLRATTNDLGGTPTPTLPCRPPSPWE